MRTHDLFAVRNWSENLLVPDSMVTLSYPITHNQSEHFAINFAKQKCLFFFRCAQNEMRYFYDLLQTERDTCMNRANILTHHKMQWFFDSVPKAIQNETKRLYICPSHLIPPPRTENVYVWVAYMRVCECVKYRIHSKYYDIKYVNIYTFRDMETYISCKYIYLFVVLFVICFHSLQVNFHIHWPLLQKIVNTIRNSSNSEGSTKWIKHDERDKENPNEK